MISSEVWNCCLGIKKLSIGIDTSAAVFGIMRFNETKELRFQIVGATHNGATILHPNTKVLVNQGLFVFLEVKNNSLSPLHLFPDLLGLNPRLQPQVEKIKPLIYCINERCVL